MNHIFRTLWNPSTGTCVATCEHTSAQGRSASSSSVSGAIPNATRLADGPSVWAWRMLPLAVMLAWGGLAMATPQGGVVSSGSASISQAPGQMTITQNSPQVAINWQSFGIAAGQSVQFVQPGRSAVALNRVTGTDPSAILGRLSANGQVFLVNPNGILFGSGASVDVGGLVASTLNISDADFMAGRYRFSGPGAAELLNQGALQAANGGYVALLGAQVNNQGTVVAPRGSVAMAAGQAMTLDLLGNQLLSVRVDQGVANALLSNGGLLQANGGQVLMSTQAAGNVLANAVNNTGVVQAQTVENRQGTIVLLGSMDSGTVSLGGTLDVSAGPGQKAGRVLATGHKVGLFDAHILASGGAGGGQVLIGGGYQGRDPSVPNAQAVYMSAGATIEANAREQGDGGQVVLWADGSTRALGRVSARGGAKGGDGGLIETSGQWLDVGGLRVDTRAPLGQTGTWLLDPADITISSAATTDATATGGVFTPNSEVSAANINVADLVTALGGSNVTVSTANTGLSGAGLGDIDVNAVVTWTAPTTLTLNAARDVNVNQAITGTDGSLALNAGRDVTVAAAITTTTGQLGFTAAQDVNINAATTITTGNLKAVAGRNVTVSAASSVTTGNMVLRADNDGTGPGAAAGTVVITCGSNCLTVTTGELIIRFNPVDYASTGSEILAYANNLTGGGTLDAKAWVFGLGDNKVYDGTTTATVSGLVPDVTDAPPPVTLGPVSEANFDTRNVGTEKPIIYTSTFSDGTYDLFATAEAPAGTYQARADITTRPLTVSAVTDARIYNGTTSSVGVPTVTGLQTGDTLDGALTQTFASKDVLGEGASTLVASGSYSVSDGNGGNNYSVSVLTAPGTISPAPLTITAQDVSKVYGQTPVLSGFDASALVNGETVGSVTLTSAGQVATASVAGSPYAIVPSNATGGTFTPGNYTISYVNGALAVTPTAVIPPIQPPVLIDPEVLPPEIPVVVEPEVVVPPPEPPAVVVPPQEPPVVVVPPQEPPAVVVPEQPSVAPPPVATSDQAPSATSEKQALPTMPRRDARPVLLTVIPPLPLVQGPVTQPVTQAPLLVPLQTPAPPQPQPPVPIVSTPAPAAPPAVQEEVKPQVPLPVVTPRRPKQDRN
ncbi:filamentous hemagglutinin N-terminal domain-containing protein [Limnohabitans sp.]|uniref:two-partner secretion domain-containing protein n=1 Tax=Limnohabitans sp. TaxID=1907725 RepID=UPI0025C1ABD0|nr:filamentous hemagglutinin N-terminal domain-containing protein [Limnohabitans sp.]